MEFIPKNKEEEKAMLECIGVDSIKLLFSDIPEQILLKKNLDMEKPLSEAELRRKVENIASKNKVYKTSFLGGGSYNHYIPSVVNHIISKPEFYTAYTPYQAEMSQGILQAIFEYQTMICELTGMDVSNASVYDGAEALAEAAIICLNKTRRDEIIISKAVHPEYRVTVKTYLNARDKKLVEIDLKDGKTDLEKLKEALDENTAGVLVQSPNFLGQIEEDIYDLVHENGSLLTVAISDPSCLGILKQPKADIITAEGQSFGNPRCFGGPYLGVIAAKQELMRYVPGRIVGQTIDADGKKGYVLTLQAREQHIRREKAACNICSNEALNALAATVYLSALGKEGMKELGELNLQKAHYAAEKLQLKFKGNFYNEFVVEVNDDIEEELEKEKIEAGLRLEKFYPELKNCMLFCVTAMNFNCNFSAA
jgi:glycine dehydrogenase subunit 1